MTPSKSKIMPASIRGPFIRGGRLAAFPPDPARTSEQLDNFRVYQYRTSTQRPCTRPYVPLTLAAGESQCPPAGVPAANQEPPAQRPSLLRKPNGSQDAQASPQSFGWF